MTDSAELERRYQRLLAWYPATFRAEHGQEILGVLLDSAHEGQQRVAFADAADLIRSALMLRLSPASWAPVTVVRAVRLMRVGCLATIAALITTFVTEASVRAAMTQRATAHQWSLMLVHLTAVEVIAPVTVVGWLWLAQAIGRGRDWARAIFFAYFGVTTLSLIFMLAERAAVYASADLIALAVLWLVQVSVLVLIFSKRSSLYYRPQLTSSI